MMSRNEIMAITTTSLVPGWVPQGPLPRTWVGFCSRAVFLFPMQVVCAHAVSVPPTPSLSARVSGYLPIHCIHQLAKTRTFRKHGISIKVSFW